MATMQNTISATSLTSEAKFHQWEQALRSSHNGFCDLDALLASEYGQEMRRLSALRYTFEEDPMGEACLNFYRELGVKKEMFETDHFYTRWSLFSPLEALNCGQEKTYPLIFWNHGGGNAIEVDEFSCHLTQMVGKEGFYVCMLQNTCWENLDRVLTLLLAHYPIDSERVYVLGYSQGGQAAHSALLRIPHRLAAVCPCGVEAFQKWDHVDVRYTLEEVERLQDVFVPVMQISGTCEFLNLLPHNQWRPIKVWETNYGPINLYHAPDEDLPNDPTNPPGKRADKPAPLPHTDGDRWKVDRLNLRLDSLNCKRVDPDRCIAYQDTPEDELHHALGFYGDQETIRTFYGLKHYQIDCINRDGYNAYRYIGVDNHPHWPPVMMAELAWEFFRKFRRDSQSGQIIEKV